MFIAALFIIARTWKQPRCPSADEWIRKLWYIYTHKQSQIVHYFNYYLHDFVTAICLGFIFGFSLCIFGLISLNAITN